MRVTRAGASSERKSSSSFTQNPWQARAAAQIGQWVPVERDLTQDYRSAFGEPPGRINAVAVATDTDNTESATVSYFSDVVFLSRSTGR